MTNAIAYRTRWADMDPNGHMRHSAYADYAADQRLVLLAEWGYDIKEFARLRLGPILFREETVFLKEVHIGEEIRVDSRLRGVNDDGTPLLWFPKADLFRPEEVTPFRLDRPEDKFEPVWMHGMGMGFGSGSGTILSRYADRNEANDYGRCW